MIPALCRLARSQEGLVERAEQPAPPIGGTAIPPCRAQVRDAVPLIGVLALRLQSRKPVDVRGIARLRALLSDGEGPCYTRVDPHALTIALERLSRCLDVTD